MEETLRTVIGCFAIACALLVASSTSAVAQRSVVGITGGATYGKIDGSIDSDWRWGGTAGLFAAWRPSRGSNVNLEANWTQKGGNGARLDYIEVPLTIGAAYQLDNGFRTNLYTGIALNLRVGCSTTAEAPPGFRDCGRAKSPEWSWPFGVFFGVERGGKLIGVDARYNVGLSDTFESIFSENRTWHFRLVLGRRTGGSRR